MRNKRGATSTRRIVSRVFLLFIGIAAVAYFALRPTTPSLRDEVVQVLDMSLSQDQSAQVRATIARSLGRVGDPHAIDPLLAAYVKDDAILPDVIAALQEMGVKPADLDERARKRRTESPNMLLEPVRKWLSQVDARVWLRNLFLYVCVAGLAVAIFTIVASLRKQLSFPAALRRSLLAGSATSISSAALLGLLYYAILSPNRPIESVPHVSPLTIIELARRTKDEAALPLLRDILDDEQRPSEERWRAAEALGAIGSESSVGILKKAFVSNDQQVRRYSAWALGNILAKNPSSREDKLTENNDTKERLARLTELLNERPNSYPLYIERAGIFVAIGDYEQARNSLDKAAVLSGGNDPSVFVERGFVFALRNDHSRAIEDYTRAVGIDPQSSLARFRRGLSYTATKEFQAAIDDFSAVISMSPGMRDAFLDRGDAFIHLGQVDNAVADYRRYLASASEGIERQTVEAKLQALTDSKGARTQSQ